MSKKDVKKKTVDSESENKFIHDAASKSLNYLTTINISAIGFIVALTKNSEPAKRFYDASIGSLSLSLLILFLGHMCLLFNLFIKNQNDLKWKLKLLMAFSWVFFVAGIFLFVWS